MIEDETKKDEEAPPPPEGLPPPDGFSDDDDDDDDEEGDEPGGAASIHRARHIGCKHYTANTSAIPYSRFHNMFRAAYVTYSRPMVGFATPIYPAPPSVSYCAIHDPSRYCKVLQGFTRNIVACFHMTSESENRSPLRNSFVPCRTTSAGLRRGRRENRAGRRTLGEGAGGCATGKIFCKVRGRWQVHRKYGKHGRVYRPLNGNGFRR